MAQLTYHNAAKYRYSDSEDQPIGNEETIKDKLIHKLVHKQLQTAVNIKDARAGKAFVHASVQEPIRDCFGGLLALTEFRDARNAAETRELLRSCDLTDADIQFLQKQSPASSSDAFLQAKLQSIDAKIANRQKQLDECNRSTEKFSGSVPLSRHAYEEECIKVSTSEFADKLTKCLVHVEPDLNPLYRSDHPIHHLPALAQQLFPPDVPAGKLRKKNKKRRRLATSGESEQEVLRGLESQKRNFSAAFNGLEQEDDDGLNHKSLWDVKRVSPTVNLSDKLNCNDYTAVNVVSSNSCHAKPFAYTMVVEPRTTDYSKPFVLTLKPQDLLSAEDIRSNCLPSSTLKEQFVSYERGVPTSVLYIKNLPHKLQPRVLASIFGNFEPTEGPKNSYRLLKGKMRGQAFVNLSSPDVADKAISLCNGYLIENKPMVISFGKESKK